MVLQCPLTQQYAHFLNAPNKGKSISRNLQTPPVHSFINLIINKLALKIPTNKKEPALHGPALF
jgi:hypothetical protein